MPQCEIVSFAFYIIYRKWSEKNARIPLTQNQASLIDPKVIARRLANCYQSPESSPLITHRWAAEKRFRSAKVIAPEAHVNYHAILINFNSQRHLTLNSVCCGFASPAARLIHTRPPDTSKSSRHLRERHHRKSSRVGKRFSLHHTFSFPPLYAARRFSVLQRYFASCAPATKTVRWCTRNIVSGDVESHRASLSRWQYPERGTETRVFRAV